MHAPLTIEIEPGQKAEAPRASLDERISYLERAFRAEAVLRA